MPETYKERLLHYTTPENLRQSLLIARAYLEQRARGAQPDPDFALDFLAGEAGTALRGCLQALSPDGTFESAAPASRALLRLVSDLPQPEKHLHLACPWPQVTTTISIQDGFAPIAAATLRETAESQPGSLGAIAKVHSVLYHRGEPFPTYLGLIGWSQEAPDQLSIRLPNCFHPESFCGHLGPSLTPHNFDLLLPFGGSPAHAGADDRGDLLWASLNQPLA